MYRNEQIKLLVEKYLPKQQKYYLIRKGEEYALFGRSIRPHEHGLLVFANLERAEQFCMTIANSAEFHLSNVSAPVGVSADELLAEVQKRGAICLVEGLRIMVAAITQDGKTKAM